MTDVHAFHASRLERRGGARAVSAAGLWVRPGSRTAQTPPSSSGRRVKASRAVHGHGHAPCVVGAAAPRLGSAAEPVRQCACVLTFAAHALCPTLTGVFRGGKSSFRPSRRRVSWRLQRGGACPEL